MVEYDNERLFPYNPLDEFSGVDFPLFAAYRIVTGSGAERYLADKADLLDVLSVLPKTMIQKGLSRLETMTNNTREDIKFVLAATCGPNDLFDR